MIAATEARDIAIDRLQPWPGLNPRMRIERESQEELAASVAASGLLNPVIVHDRGDGLYWIVAGERRWRAAKAAGKSVVPCRVGEYTEAEALEVALAENLHRRDLSPIEEARAYRRWLALHPDATQAQLADRIGKSQPYLSNRLRLLDLPEDAQQAVHEGRLTASDARDVVLRAQKNGQPEKARRVVKAAKRGPLNRRQARAVADLPPPPPMPDGVRVVEDDGRHYVEARLPVESRKAGLMLARRINEMATEAR